MDQKKIGSFIAELRKERGFTQDQLAEKLNVSQKSVSRWETGKNMPDLSLFSELCAILGISLAELIQGERIVEPTLTKEEASGILAAAMELMKERQQRRKILSAIITGILTLVCMFALYRSEFCVNITSSTALEEAINEYHFVREMNANVLEMHTEGNSCFVLYQQEDHPTCGGLAQLRKGLFGRYRIIGTSDFTWPLYQAHIEEFSGNRYLLVFAINELPGVDAYEIDVIQENGQIQTRREKVESGAFIHICEIEDGAVVFPSDIRYYDLQGAEILSETLRELIPEDTGGDSSGTGTVELGMLYFYEIIVFGIGLVMVRYFLSECEWKKLLER